MRSPMLLQGATAAWPALPAGSGEATRAQVQGRPRSGVKATLSAKGLSLSHHSGQLQGYSRVTVTCSFAPAAVGEVQQRLQVLCR